MLGGDEPSETPDGAIGIDAGDNSDEDIKSGDEEDDLPPSRDSFHSIFNYLLFRAIVPIFKLLEWISPSLASKFYWIFGANYLLIRHIFFGHFGYRDDSHK